MTAALIALLSCPRCGHSRLPPERPCDAVCTCRPPNPAQLAADVAYRHRAAVERARRNMPTR